MKTAGKIIVAGIIGTTFMTLYSYWRSKKENEQYLEPVMLNKLIQNSDALPAIEDEESHPAGWGLHYVAGVAFVASYWLIWRKVLKNPSPFGIITTGAASGIVGILIWKMMFANHENPPHNYRYGYYQQLFIAHIIFSLTAAAAYSMASNLKLKTEDPFALPEKSGIL
ncbi:MAG: hypothetical protein ACO1N9_04845 [Flavobacterium sp.]